MFVFRGGSSTVRSTLMHYAGGASSSSGMQTETWQAGKRSREEEIWGRTDRGRWRRWWQGGSRVNLRQEEGDGKKMEMKETLCLGGAER